MWFPADAEEGKVECDRAGENNTEGASSVVVASVEEREVVDGVGDWLRRDLIAGSGFMVVTDMFMDSAREARGDVGGVK